jgi:hypothetical protein
MHGPIQSRETVPLRLSQYRHLFALSDKLRRVTIGWRLGKVVTVPRSGRGYFLRQAEAQQDPEQQDVFLMSSLLNQCTPALKVMLLLTSTLLSSQRTVGTRTTVNQSYNLVVL